MNEKDIINENALSDTEIKEYQKQLEDLDSHIINLEDAKKHFKDYFYPSKNANTNLKSNNQTQKDETPELG